MSVQKATTINEWTMETLAAYVAEIVAKESGNVLGENQKSMVLNRLKKRLIDLGNLSPEEYFNHLQEGYEIETTHLISLLTTHHTFFFREFSHFEYLLQNLEQIVERVKKRGESKIRVLSAACSRGQEVYSLAMFFQYHLKKFPGMTYEILGTDIDPESVKIADNGVYPYNEVKSIPQMYLMDNWQRGTGDISRFAKIKPHLKKECSFKVMNLLRPEEVLGIQKFDIILCRNVFIYFDMQDIEKIVNNFKKYLNSNGLFITGLSESLKSINVEKQTFAPSVYCFDSSVIGDTAGEKLKTDDSVIHSRKEVSLIPKPIRILAVDDSSSVLKLLSKIFTSDSDFELVGTAKNGLEAEDFFKKNQVDAMTLDIHMPEMDGVQYLKKNFKQGHPHVIVVSSASREDTRYAQETLKNGACDFVEKPALNNLAERADEIKNKIKMAFLNSNNAISHIDKSFSSDHEIKNAEKKARFFVANFSDKKKVLATISELEGEQPPLFIFFEGNGNFLSVIKDELSSIRNLEIYDSGVGFKKGNIYLCDLKSHFDEISTKLNLSKVSLSVFGIVSSGLEKILLDKNIGQVLIEDNSSINKDVREIANDIFPWTSFAHVGSEFLAKLG